MQADYERMQKLFANANVNIRKSRPSEVHENTLTTNDATKTLDAIAAQQTPEGVCRAIIKITGCDAVVRPRCNYGVPPCTATCPITAELPAFCQLKGGNAHRHDVYNQYFVHFASIQAEYAKDVFAGGVPTTTTVNIALGTEVRS